MNKLSEITAIQNPYFKDSFFAFSKKMERSASSYFEKDRFDIFEHSSFLEVVIPTSSQYMAEDLTQILADSFHLNVMYAISEDSGKVIKVVAYSEPVEDNMYIIYISSTMYGVVDFITVHFFDSTEVMYMYLQKAYRMIPSNPSCVFEKQDVKDILKSFI